MSEPAEERPEPLARADSPPTPVADLSEYSPSEYSASTNTPTSQFVDAVSNGAKPRVITNTEVSPDAAPPTYQPSPQAHFVLMDDFTPRSSLGSLGFSGSNTMKKHFAPIWFYILAVALSMVINLLALVGIFFVTKGDMRRRMYAGGCLTGAFIQAFSVIAFYKFILQ